MGFVESFRANFYCRFYKIHRNDAQKEVTENSLILRTSDEYSKIFADKSTTFSDFNESKGIKRYCKLNDLNFFDMIKGNNVDIMHEVLEGAVPFIIKNFFKACTNKKLITITEINNKIRSFNFGFLYRKS